jgi:hypothetical protein
VVPRLALGLKAPGEDHALLRTRKAELIETADIVWDVGGVFDAAGRRFDHHQRGAPVREDGTPFRRPDWSGRCLARPRLQLCCRQGLKRLPQKLPWTSMEAGYAWARHASTAGSSAVASHQPQIIRRPGSSAATNAGRRLICLPREACYCL